MKWFRYLVSFFSSPTPSCHRGVLACWGVTFVFASACSLFCFSDPPKVGYIDGGSCRFLTQLSVFGARTRVRVPEGPECENCWSALISCWTSLLAYLKPAPLVLEQLVRSQTHLPVQRSPHLPATHGRSWREGLCVIIMQGETPAYFIYGHSSSALKQPSRYFIYNFWN